MPTQTSYFQSDVLAAAVRNGTLGSLYWFVEAHYPRRMVRQGVSARQPAMWPHGFIPVLPAGPDPETQREWAGMLSGLFEAGNQGRGIEFRPTLTSLEMMDGLRWYEYGEQPHYQVDYVCDKCGQVMTAPVGQAPQCECWEW